MTQERDLSWLDEPDESDEDSEEPAEEDSDAQLTVESEEAEEKTESDEESESAAPDYDPTGVEALLAFDPATADPDREAADALFAAQQAEARRLGAVNLDPEPYVVPPPDGPYELAAQKVSRMDSKDVEFFTRQLRDASAARERAARAGSPGFDASGDPVETLPPLDITALSSEDFSTLMDAVSRGRANPSRTPSQYSAAEWERIVDQTIGER